MKTRLLPLCLLLVLFATLTACSYDMEIRGVKMQPYEPAPIPPLFDEAMAAFRTVLAGHTLADLLRERRHGLS